ncbi:MAG TPA: glycosyltransferase family 2 protein, partial [Candidatus Xenobia bacterium]
TIEHCDVASGTRYHPLSKAVGDPPVDRRRINEQVTGWIRCVTGWPLTDAFCGYKVYRVDALRKLSLQERGPAFPIEFWVQAWHAGLKVEEVPTPRIYLDAARSFGGSLDRPETRLSYYEEVLKESLQRIGHPPLRIRSRR